MMDNVNICFDIDKEYQDFLLKEDGFKPLIFQKLNDNRIQELLSAQVLLELSKEIGSYSKKHKVSKKYCRKKQI